MTASLPAHDVPRELPRDVRRADARHAAPDHRRRRRRAGPPPGGAGRLGARGVPRRRGAGRDRDRLLRRPVAGPPRRVAASRPEAPGLESAARQGRRPGRIRRLADSGPAIALVALGLGLVLTAEAIFGNGVVIWALVLAVVGFGLLWRQADEAQRARWLDQSERLNPVRAVFGTRRLGGVRPGRRRCRPRRRRRGALRGPPRPRRTTLHDVLVAAALGGIGLAITLGPLGLAADQRPRRPSAPSGSAPRSGPTSPPTSTTRSCRPSP